MPRDGVPAGEVRGPFAWNRSAIYPGTERNYWLYVPAQYDAAKSACVLVVQDGLGRAREWRLPTVLDNLIHAGEVPVIVGIFIDPGVVPAGREDAQARFNRSFEYDSMGDLYARFLLEEILPEVGKTLNLSSDPSDRAIAGASSGAICAFTAAWERPDAFRRVLSTIGTYVGLRGGNEYPTLIRKTEPKPIRVFLQDGSRDLNIYGGDWWIANQAMLSALTFAGYDVRHEWGTGGHDGRHGAAVMPDALRWLWRGHPEPIRAGAGAARRPSLLIPGEEWKLVSEGHAFTEGPAVNAKGEVFFSDVRNGRIHKVDLEGKVTVFVENSPGVNGLMFGPDGDLWACQNGARRIVRYGPDGSEEVVLEDVGSNDIVVSTRGVYFTDPREKSVWRVGADGKRTLADQGIEFPNGVVTTADQAFLLVADRAGRFVYSFRIEADGALAHRQRYGWVHMRDSDGESGADGMTVDADGRLYLATYMGIQVFDQLGRANLILPVPGGKRVTNVVFGGPDLDTLYVTSLDKVYRRRVRARGVVPWKDPLMPPRPRL
jgi:sugar lactone lactonase YvrE/enterochelin esterase-like enzyme